MACLVIGKLRNADGVLEFRPCAQLKLRFYDERKKTDVGEEKYDEQVDSGKTVVTWLFTYHVTWGKSWSPQSLCYL